MSAGTALSHRPARGPGAIALRRLAALAGNPTAAGVLALTALAAALRFYRLGHQGFWFDEANTVLLVHFSLGKMIGLIPQTESTPPLYYCLAWVWARIFGFGEAGLRSLSAVAGVLVVPVTYGAGAKLLSRRAGVIVAALAACNPFLIWYSQEARSYSLLVLLCTLALFAFALVLEAPSPRRAALWAVSCAMALATHYYAVVVVAPQMAWLVWTFRRNRVVTAGVGVVLACGLALVPLALSQNSTGRDSWIAHSSFSLRLEQIAPQFLIGTDAPARVALKFAAFALILVALLFLFAPSGRAAQDGARALPVARRGALVAGGLALAGFLLSLAFAAAGSDALITRNIIGLWTPAAIAVAGGLAMARPRLLGMAVAAALCGIGLSAALAVAFNYDFQRPDWRLVARVLGPAPTGPPVGATRLILIQHYRTLLPLSLSLPGLHVLGRGGASSVQEIDVIAMSSPQQPLCWWGAACNLFPSQIQSVYPVPGFRKDWVRRVRRFTIVRLVPAGRNARVTPQEVSRVLHTTTLRRDELLVQR